MIRSVVALLALLVGSSAPLVAQTGEWWRSAVCYEVFVRSFFDSDGDGVGDLPGLTAKLDYVRDLGANCIWLMPVAQSPSYHSYDVSNYYQINRDYGTNEDFKRLVAEAHRRGIRVIVDLVLNHMSSEHPFFKSALLRPDSPYRDWFLWSPTQRRTDGWQVATWHKAPTRDEYYYGLFWHGMPDLNLAAPEVRAEAQRITRFWLEEMGVDGFRLDAVGHFFEEGSSAGSGPKTHPWLRDFEAHVERIKPGSFTVGEVWDSMGAILPYYPDQLDAYFAFELSDALLDAVRSGSGQRLVSIVERAGRDLPAGRWATFLRNHDQTRTLTALKGDLPRARLAASLLLTLPGVPFVYYGEELGMTGDKPDPRLRTPMHWSRGPAAGFSTGVPWEPLQPDSLSANVEVQQGDSTSLLNHYRRLIRLRTANPALHSGDFVPLRTGSNAALAFLRRARGRTALVTANLGSKPIPGPQLVSAGTVLPPGRYIARPLLGGTREIDLRVTPDGQITGPMPSLEPFASQVWELSQR